MKKGMSTALLISLIIGGAVALVFLVYYMSTPSTLDTVLGGLN